MKLKQNKLAHVSSTLIVTKGKELPAGQFEAVLSTEDLDRHGEIVSIKGLQVPKNQVIKIYYNHETTGTSLPIGQWTKIWKNQEGKLMGRGQIDLLDEFEVKIDKKIKLGTLDSISIGFYPLEYDGDSSTWTKSTLVEASVVAEPANVAARVTSKALGFTDEEFKSALRVKLKATKEAEIIEPVNPDDVQPIPEEDDKIEVKRIVKGAVEDVLLSPKKWELMRPYYDVIYAFEEAFYSEEAEAEDFKQYLTETIGLLQKVADGTFDATKDLTKSSDESATGEFAEIKSAIDELNSRQGAVEAALQAAIENPAKKNVEKVRYALKKVDQSAEEANRVIKVKLKEI